jgi:hypothetical protein
MAGKNNLKPFKKGDSRINRNGRPKTVPGLDKLLIEVLGAEVGKKSKVQLVLEKLVKLAINGNVRAAELILNRAYGKPVETIISCSDITTNGESLNDKIDWQKVSTETIRELMPAISN